MKVICLLLSLCLLLGISAVPAGAEGVDIPNILLYTFYRQTGWGDSVQVGCVDEKGGIWMLTGQDDELRWPYSPSEQLSYLKSCGSLIRQGRLNDADLQDIRSLVSAVPDMGSSGYPAADDAGTEASYAVRYDGWGNPVPVLLGMSGDSAFENFDANAQALYLGLRNLFPQVTNYAYSYGYMGPQGFQAISLRSFCGFDGISFDNASVTGTTLGFGAGSPPSELGSGEQERIFSLLLNGQVTGKANASYVTGSSVLYTFSDNTGNTLASIELYNGLLVRPDGMYYLQ